MASAMNSISVGCNSFLRCAELVHQFVVDVQAAGGVDEDHVAGGEFGFLDGAADDFERLVGAGAGPELRADGFGDLRELFARGGTVDVGGNDEGAMAVLREPFGELAGGGGFAGALQADDHPDRRRARSEERLGVLAEQRGELVANGLDDLLVGRKLQHDFAADGLLRGCWRAVRRRRRR